jgi:hypothetical protein
MARNRLSVAGLMPKRFLRSLDRTGSKLREKLHG